MSTPSDDKPDGMPELPVPKSLRFARRKEDLPTYSVTEVRDIQLLAYSAGQRAAAVRAAQVCETTEVEAFRHGGKVYDDVNATLASAAAAIRREFGVNKEQDRG